MTGMSMSGKDIQILSVRPDDSFSFPTLGK